MLNNLLQMHLKLLQKEQLQNSRKIVDLIRKRSSDKITVSRTSPQISSETVTNENDKEIPKERYISPEERQKIIDDLRLI